MADQSLRGTPSNPSQRPSVWVLLGVVCLLLAVDAIRCVAATEQAERPNIIVIMADDLGFADLGCYGGEIETPHLDRLAANGLRMTQFYNTAKCETSRRTLLTGMWHPEVVEADGPGQHRMIAEYLADAGYTTLMVGKWHIQADPLARGFQQYFGHLSGATDFFRGDNTFRLGRDRFEVPESGFYTTDANTDYAIRFLEDAIKRDAPFFLYMAYNAPHYPLQAPREDIERYRGRYRAGWDELRSARYRRQLELGIINENWPLSPRPDDVQAWSELTAEQQEQEDLTMAVFAAMVDRLDRNIGRMVDSLDRFGCRDNTVIMFFSDNGGCPFQRSHHLEIPPWQGGSHLTYHKAWAGVSNTPFRWYKQNNHEGGISSPMIVSWPAGIASPGRIADEVGHLVDILPTCLELAGVTNNSNVSSWRGQSLTPLFRGEPTGERELFWQFAKNRAVRIGDWKLVSAVGGPWELYNLQTDRTELNDLAETETVRAADMERRWDQWANQVGAKRDLRKPRVSDGVLH